MIGVGVIDMALLGIWRDGDQWNAGAVAEEIDRLDVAGIVIASPFIHRDQNRGLSPERFIALNARDQINDKVFIGGRGRIGGVTGLAFKRPDKRNRRQC